MSEKSFWTVFILCACAALLSSLFGYPTLSIFIGSLTVGFGFYRLFGLPRD